MLRVFSGLQRKSFPLSLKGIPSKLLLPQNFSSLNPPKRCFHFTKAVLSEDGKQKTKPKTGLTFLKTPENESRTHRTILLHLMRYMWPKNNANAKFRVVLALGLLIGAKVLNVYVPFFFKDIVDAMNVDWSALQTGTGVFTGLVLSYGLARFGSTFFG